MLVAVLGSIAVLGCASAPKTTVLGDTYLTRSVTESKEGITVTTSVLDQREIQEVFGARLHLVGIQPVWIRISNLSALTFTLFLVSIDPHYLSPYEVARRSAAVSKTSTEVLYPFLRDREVERFITPGAQVEGYVYTHLDEGFKAVNVDFVGNRKTLSFNMAVTVPGLVTDFEGFDARAVYTNPLPALSEARLRAWLGALPWCTTTADGSLDDPINLVLVGEIKDIRAAMVRQHWDVTARATGSSLRRMVSPFVFGSRYRYAPISKLYLFEREQDLTLQKARAVIDERNHVRLWLAPATYEGIPIWVGHISRDTGVKLASHLWPPITHIIDPAVDEARFYIEQDLLYSQRVDKIELVEGVGPAPVDAPRYNAEQDPYFTDGFRAVFFIGKESVLFDDLEVLNWGLQPEMEPFRESIFDPTPAVR